MSGMKSVARRDLKYLLLDMISTTRLADTKKTAGLGASDWQTLCKMAAQHRLGPILHHHRKMHAQGWAVPEDVANIWAESYRQSALRSLRVRHSLHRLDAILNAALIPYAALKGAWLFLHAYTQPALRPMRDIDIIVAPENALKVLDILERNGFKRRDEYAKPPEHALEYTKHLPPLRCQKSGISVEVHTRLMEHITVTEKSGTIGDTSALLERIERHGGIAFLPPTDTLLHLIVHAVYDHHFDNGPLTLNDIASLVRSSEIDWERFWAMAKIGNWARGCSLLFAMVRRYHDQVVLPYPAGTTPPPSTHHLDCALLLTLQDFDQRAIVSFRAELAVAPSLLRRTALLWRRAFPARHVLAAFAGSPSASWWILVHYPKWLIVRAGQMLFERQSDDVKIDIRRAAHVASWLQAKENA